jgi:hypothetical protein
MAAKQSKQTRRKKNPPTLQQQESEVWNLVAHREAQAPWTQATRNSMLALAQVSKRARHGVRANTRKVDLDAVRIFDGVPEGVTPSGMWARFPAVQEVRIRNLSLARHASFLSTLPAAVSRLWLTIVSDGYGDSRQSLAHGNMHHLKAALARAAARVKELHVHFQLSPGLGRPGAHFRMSDVDIQGLERLSIDAVSYHLPRGRQYGKSTEYRILEEFDVGVDILPEGPDGAAHSGSSGAEGLRHLGFKGRLGCNQQQALLAFLARHRQTLETIDAPSLPLLHLKPGCQGGAVLHNTAYARLVGLRVETHAKALRDALSSGAFPNLQALDVHLTADGWWQNPENHLDVAAILARWPRLTRLTIRTTSNGDIITGLDSLSLAQGQVIRIHRYASVEPRDLTPGRRDRLVRDNDKAYTYTLENAAGQAPGGDGGSTSAGSSLHQVRASAVAYGRAGARLLAEDIARYKWPQLASPLSRREWPARGRLIVDAHGRHMHQEENKWWV